jgi:hypothetical protein
VKIIDIGIKAAPKNNKIKKICRADATSNDFETLKLTVKTIVCIKMKTKWVKKKLMS